MIARCTNARSGRAARAAAFVLPAVFALLGASGVTVRPVLGMRELHAEVERARARAAACGEARERVARYDAAGGTVALDRALAVVTDALPRPLRTVDLHAIVTLAAERRGVEIASISILEPRESRHPTLGDAVVETPFELRGTARLSALAEIAVDLRRAGLPASVVEFTLARTDPAAERFEFRLSLALHQRAPATPPNPTAASDAGQEE